MLTLCTSFRLIVMNYRYNYIDVYKGILILMVVYGHIAYAVSKYADGYTDSVYQFLGDVAMTWMAPYYMAAFFVATGFCMNLSKPYLSQLKTDALTLLLPGVVVPIVMNLLSTGDINLLKIGEGIVLHGAFSWFLVALFLAKQMYRLLLRLPAWSRTVLTLGGAMSGILVFSNQITEYWCMWHALVLLPFLGVGSYMKMHKDWLPKVGVICGFIYVLLIMLLRGLKHTIPAFCSTINFGIFDTPLFLLLTITGSAFVMSIAKLIDKQPLLEYMGRNSLVTYLTHFTFFAIIIPIIKPYILDSQYTFVTSISVFWGLFVGALLWCCIWIRIINMPYLSWIIGKKP